ncbi:MAG: hypothetical protein FWE40_02520 [Oscillospiraceae bacterium]|nr:hypothetical protein [Oscillospiraceae bacterium]
MDYDQAAFLNLHVLLQKAKVPLECFIENPVCPLRAEVLASIAQDYLTALDEAIEVVEEGLLILPSPAQKTSHSHHVAA